MKSLLMFTVLFLSSCATAHKNDQYLADEIEVPAHVTIEFQGQTKILLTYTFSKPVIGFKFLRDYTKYRSGNWQSLDPSIEVVSNHQGLEIVRNKNGKHFSMASFRISPLKELLDTDYSPIIPFSNGEALIYPQQFVAVPLPTLDGFENWKPIESFKFPKFQKVVITSQQFKKGIFDGEQKDLPFDVTDLLQAPQDGPYVYVGNQTPSARNKFATIFAPKVPGWVRSYIERDFPRAMSLLEQRLLAPPKKTPILFVIPFDSEKGKKATVRGDASSGLKTKPIALFLIGDGWEKPDSEKKKLLDMLIVHEPIHIWNSPAFADFAPIAWMYEGGAEALRVRAELLLKIWPIKRYEEFHVEYAQRCVDKYIPPLTLSTMKVIPTYNLVYACGLILGLVTEQILDDRDYFGFWAELLRRARLKGMKYGKDDYFELLNERSRKKEIISKIRSFIENPQGDRRTELVRLLEIVGIPVADQGPIQFKAPAITSY